MKRLDLEASLALHFNGGEPTEPTEPFNPDDMVATLQAFWDVRHRFQPGQLVTPKPNSQYHGQGRPHVVMEFSPDLIDEVKDPGATVGSSNWGMRPDMRVLHADPEGFVHPHWVESFAWEPWEGSAAEEQAHHAWADWLKGRAAAEPKGAEFAEVGEDLDDLSQEEAERLIMPVANRDASDEPFSLIPLWGLTSKPGHPARWNGNVGIVDSLTGLIANATVHVRWYGGSTPAAPVYFDPQTECFNNGGDGISMPAGWSADESSDEVAERFVKMKVA